MAKAKRISELTGDEKIYLISEIIRDPFAECRDLDDRERQVVNLASYGAPISKIAKQLEISRAQGYKLLGQALARLKKDGWDIKNLADIQTYILKKIKEIIQ